MGVRPLRRAWPELALLVVLLTAPILLPPLGFSHDLLSRALNWALFGLGLDILFGLAGLLSFGQGIFFEPVVQYLVNGSSYWNPYTANRSKDGFYVGATLIVPLGAIFGLSPG